MSSLTPLKTFSICSSSSVRSVMIRTRASGDVLANPLGQPHHGQALARSLRVPDDAALAALRRNSCAARTPKYWLWRQSFLVPASKTKKSWISSRNRALAQSWIKARSSGFSNGAVLLPSEVILLRRLDGAVAQALGVVARHDQLHRGEEVLDEDLFLVVEVLADALGHRNGGALQLQHASAMPLT